MKCADCGKEHIGIRGLMFKEDGKVPGLIMPRYRAQCAECSKKVPIDDNVNREIAEEYPF